MIADANLVPVFTAEEIQNRIESLSDAIAADCMQKEITLVGILDGCYMFLTDIVRALHQRGIRVRVEFLSLSSYGSGTVSSGSISLRCDISHDIHGQHVLVIDDIVDTGLTLQFAVAHLGRKNPSSLKTCILLDKQARRMTDITTDYRGFTIDNFFAAGYGLDYEGRYRQLPGIYKVIL